MIYSYTSDFFFMELEEGSKLRRRRFLCGHTLYLTTTFVLVGWIVGVVDGGYRHYYLDNADLCAGNKEIIKPGHGSQSSSWGKGPLSIGTGASIFKLKKPSINFQPNYRNKAIKCKIHVKAPKGHGIMVHVEMMNMRESKPTNDQEKVGCLDYIQFGQDDIVPFVTISKSNRICGQVAGVTYDDPNGNLLIWINLGGRKSTSMWPSISVVNLTLVATVYKKCGEPIDKNVLKCADSDICIWKTYACDKHLNCPNDKVPADEDGCTYHHLQTTSNNGEKINSQYPNGFKFNNVSLILMAVTLIIGAFFISLLIIRLSQKYCSRNSRSHEECELPEQPFSLQDLSNHRTIPLAENNVYLPLSNFPHPIQHRNNSPDEPPPSYDDLFPENVVTTSVMTSRDELPPQDHEIGAAVAIAPNNQPQPEDENNSPTQ